MPLSTTQQQTLHHMGIDVWQPRTILPGAKQALPACCWELFDSEQNHLGWLLIENEVTPAENELLEKMLIAFKVRGKRLGAMDVFKKITFEESDFIWVMGADLANKFSQLNSAQAFTLTPTLANCLTDRKAKKVVWQQVNLVLNKAAS